MDKSTVKKVTVVPSILVSTLLLGMTLSSPKVDARPATPSIAGTQLAWWVGGPGWYRGCGYAGCGMGYGGCGERCFRNRWGKVRCANRCWY